ncbi:MAG: hypothetical protein ABFD52_08285 [Acidobacteriota bacterium]
MKDGRIRTAGPGSGSPEIERELRRLATGPVPPGLRQRVLKRAAEARRRTALAPWMRLVAAGCSILIAAVLLADPPARRHEAARLAALLDGRTAPMTADGEAGVVAEAVGGSEGAAEAARAVRLGNLAAAASRREQERQVIEARRGLKGWLTDEAAEDLE